MTRFSWMQYDLSDISIHTPARGVTFRLLATANDTHISIHTPARGVTMMGSKQSHTQTNFNPHSRKGSDVRWRHEVPATVYFNPHSRKGSDRNGVGCSVYSVYFNPHSRKGSDSGDYLLLQFFCISIHTPARGVTQSAY